VKKTKNRWLIALSAVGIHISIGSVYAWSNFTNPLIEEFGWSAQQVQFTFSLAILFLGLSAAFLGHFVEKHGPRKAGILAASFFGVGIIGSGLAVNLGSLPLLYIFYGSLTVVV
jgi:OFA family oxalate/formate antiporter-like MFS transporter